MIISLLLVAIAAAANAAMDSMEEGHYTNSIFSRWNPNFWYKRESWKTAKRIFGYPIDGWHLSKSLMLMCLVSAACLSFEPFPHFLLNLLTLGGVWIFVFDLFYNIIFKENDKQ